ncbi:MAG: hypothetical protein MZV65_37880 [Chromatiales bacterium]|nr:hypothetical protein [Chromatiales bacterium]
MPPARVLRRDLGAAAGERAQRLRVRRWPRSRAAAAGRRSDVKLTAYVLAGAAGTLVVLALAALAAGAAR